MRLLELNIEPNIINGLKKDKLYICDSAEDFNDLTYHAEVRFYNLILVRDNDLKKSTKFLRAVQSRLLYSSTAVVFVTDNVDKKFEIELLNLGALSVITEPVDDDLLLARVEAIHRDNFASILAINNELNIDLMEKKVIYNSEHELNIKGKAFGILAYLFKNRFRSPVSKDEIIYALWEEPEMVSDNVIEVNMNLIRQEFRKKLNYDIINTVRNRGYQLKTDF